MNKKILIVGDEKEIVDLLEVYLSNDGYSVYKCYNGLEAMKCIEQSQIDLAILDIMLPDIDGFRLCQKIREKFYFPIIMLTAKIEDSDKIMGLTIGADDYITKLFNPLEVVARVKTQSRRYQSYNSPNLSQSEEKDEYDIRGLLINRVSHKCYLYGKEIALTPLEFSILWYLPDTVPLHYTISDIASLTRGYIDGYPTYTGECENGLVVVGYPKDRYWKHMSPSWDYDFIKNAPYTVLIVIGVNVFLIFLIYMIANSKLLKSVKPITNGIQALPSGEPVYVKEKGLLSDLAAKINQTSDILQKQKRNLQRKETARANWISGVSHDIRTPLSMVMGYAGQIEDNESLPESERKKARIIRQQSTKMKNLINDLNLASKLEYNMQPIHPEPVNLVAIARQSVVDFINLDMEEKYPIEWNTDEALTACAINGDKELLRRAIGNLITNSQTHNPDGCTISVCVRKSDTEYKIVVEDNGVGVTDEKLEKLRTTPHYMMSDSGTTEPRHGLGLLIVGQIVSAHKGTVSFDHGKQGGFTVTISFPIPKDSHTQ